MTRAGVLLVVVLAAQLVGVPPVGAAPSQDGPATPLPTSFAGMSYPSGTHPARSDADPVSGSVTGEPGRRVWLQAEADPGKGWVTLGRTTTDPAGNFTFPAPTFWVHKTTMRVHAPATDTFEAGTTEENGTITVTRTFKPRAGTAFARLGSGARWNPCQEITYKVNRNRMPRKGLSNVKEAFRRITEATGLRFRYGGRTRYIGWKGGKYRPIDGADIGIAWTTPAVVPGLAGSTLGFGGGASSGDFYSSGAISLDATARLEPGFKAGRSSKTGTLLMHEIGHVVGLGHVEDTRQLMAPQLSRKAGHPGAGDLRGFAAVGADGGCPSADQSRRGGTAGPTVISVAD